ncbi:phosphate/phosphite/phosphonate ABC transporter substrate-binding protein [Undibacterium parvum]|uniref:Phosphate/phosphite/phosphonate ABC transporter substrate-binding protein n=1 Tax=Undibacterium parvum TaxID=401471 RepID=A0A3Q9BR68_9BURK|nr:phosphate/phosphite/phosphonate ABC transporter substrate-binding protein [Undibacterium parvum]AZP12595.1 phosphate/phosphite/phosphonate ABC transporter substrate-binding protein [Undibacterium parvum]
MPLHHFKKYLPLLALAGTLLSNSSVFATTYSIAVVPQYNVVQLHSEWQPLLDRIARDTGITLELSLQSSIPKFERGLLKGEPDFAYANPYHAVMAKNAQGYLPIVRDSKALTGILLVRKDSPYKNISDLSGKEIGFPAPNAFGASLYMRALLAENKIKFEQRFLNTHGNVFRSILNGSVAAGGAVNNTYNDEKPEIRDQLRIIYQTPGSASHPVIVHPRVPEAVRAAVKAAFLALPKDPAGLALLKEVRLPQPLATNYESDYLQLEKLGIEKFTLLEKE